MQGPPSEEHKVTSLCPVEMWQWLTCMESTLWSVKVKRYFRKGKCFKVKFRTMFTNLIHVDVFSGLVVLWASKNGTLLSPANVSFVVLTKVITEISLNKRATGNKHERLSNKVWKQAGLFNVIKMYYTCPVDWDVELFSDLQVCSICLFFAKQLPEC